MPPTYDSLIGKLIVSDHDRPAALARAAAGAGRARGRGHRHDRAALPRDGRDGPFREGRYTTAYIEEAAERFVSLGATPS